MNEIREIRRLNLIRLIAEAGSVKTLAEEADTDPNHLSAMSSESPPLLPSGNPKGIGNKLARKLERARGKPHGWMDQRHHWGAVEQMWMELFSTLTEENKKEAIGYIEYLKQKQNFADSPPEPGADTPPEMGDTDQES